MAKPHPFPYLDEILATHPDYTCKRMFGMQAGYLGDRIVAVFGDDRESAEWNGVLLPVSREVHGALCNQFQSLVPHPVIGKWLYLPVVHPEFESLAEQLIRLIRRGDPRFGVIAEKKRKPGGRRAASGVGKRRRSVD